MSDVTHIYTRCDACGRTIKPSQVGFGYQAREQAWNLCDMCFANGILFAALQAKHAKELIAAELEDGTP